MGHWSTKPDRRHKPGLSKATASEYRPLTPAHVRTERLALAHDMLTLVAEDPALPPVLLERVHVLCEGVLALWHETRDLP